MDSIVRLWPDPEICRLNISGPIGYGALYVQFNCMYYYLMISAVSDAFRGYQSDQAEDQVTQSNILLDTSRPSAFQFCLPSVTSKPFLY